MFKQTKRTTTNKNFQYINKTTKNTGTWIKKRYGKVNFVFLKYVFKYRIGNKFVIILLTINECKVVNNLYFLIAIVNELAEGNSALGTCFIETS